MAAPTLIASAYVNANLASGASNTTASLSWHVGDVVVVIGGTEGNGSETWTAPTTTGSGLTFAQEQVHASTGSNCGGGCYATVATAASSGTITLKSPRIGGGSYLATGVYIFRGSAGIGNSNISTGSSRTVSLTPTGADGSIVWGVFDWSASAIQSTSPAATSHSASSPGPQASPNTFTNGVDYSAYVEELDDQSSAGAVSYGIGGTGAGPFTIIAIEVKAGGSTPPNSGTASGTFTFTGSASGHAVSTAAGSWTFTGSASGHKAPHGSASGGFTVTGAASGHRDPHGSASGSFTFTGSASGSQPGNHGSAAGSFTFTGSASGHKAPHGSASGTWLVTGSASGHKTPHGSASGSWTVSGSAGGHKDPHGAASGSWTVSGTASGGAPRHGSASGGFTFTGSASGHAPNGATAIGSWSFAGSATGSRPSTGTAAGSWRLTGAATGSKRSAGSAAGTFTLHGTAQGHADRSGTASGTWIFAGSAHGRTPGLRFEVPDTGFTAQIDAGRPFGAALDTSRPFAASLDVERPFSALLEV